LLFFFFSVAGAATSFGADTLAVNCFHSCGISGVLSRVQFIISIELGTNSVENKTVLFVNYLTIVFPETNFTNAMY